MYKLLLGGSTVVASAETEFIIGDRVFVGTKPGVIAYLGDVKFAHGDFAGVVLGKIYQLS